MKKTTLTTLILLSFAFMCNAQKIWSVSKDVAQKADFSEIQAAIDAASPGDYIYVYPSIYENGFSLGMPLVIVGPGYFLGDNPNTQFNKMPAIIKGEVSIGSNTDGAIIAGLTIENHMAIQNASNVSIKRNKLKTLEISGSNDIKIKQNYFLGSKWYSGGLNDYWYTLFVKANSNNIQISNNFIATEGTSESYKYYRAFLNEQTTYCTLKNNVIYGDIYCYNTNFENNVLRFSYYCLLTSCSAYNNISSKEVFGTQNGNQTNITMATVFVGSTTNPSSDGQWQLKNGSPAKGAGLNGIDCGMFGGSDPYTLSGIPDIPSIYFFEAPDGANPTTGLPIRVKIKSRQ